MIRKDGRPFGEPSEQEIAEKKEREKNTPSGPIVQRNISGQVFHRIEVPVRERCDEPDHRKLRRRKPLSNPAAENSNVEVQKERK